MSRSGPRYGLAWVAAIAVVSATLRLWRISWGLDAGGSRLAFPDEILWWLPYVRDFTVVTCASFDQTRLIYPTFYGYVFGLTTSLLHALGLVAIADPAHPFLHPSADALLVGRGVSAAAGLATVAVAGRFAWRAYSPRAGLFAAALMAVLPFEVLYSHLVSPDTLLATCMAMTSFCALRVATGGGAGWAAAAGLAAGAAAATKYPGLATTVVVGLAVVEQAVQHRRLPVGLVLAAAAGFVVAFSAGCPPCVLHPERMLDAMQFLSYVSSSAYQSLHNYVLVPSLGWYGKPYLYELVASLPYAMGWPLYALSLAGVVVAVKNHTVADRILLAAIVPYFLVMGASAMVLPRYLLPILPPLVVLAARAADSLRAPRAPRAAVLLVATVAAYTLALTASQVARFSLDQQADVAAWVAETARERAIARPRVTVPFMELDYFRLTGPLEARGLELTEAREGRWFDEDTDFFVLPRWYETAIERDMAGTEVAADLARLRSGEAGLSPAASWASSWLQEDLYAFLDPAFRTDLWQGEIGFTVYVRKEARRP